MGGVKKLDQDELALRMLESAVGMKRPGGLNATQALGCGPPHLTGTYRRAAAAALTYFIECAGPLTIIPEPKHYPDPSVESIVHVVNGNGAG